MFESIETFNYFVAIGGIALLLGAAVLAFDFYTSRSLASYVRKYGLMASFILALAGTALTLVYSEGFGVIPCGLCWFARIFLFSQVFVFGTALYLKDVRASVYGVVLSTFGFIITLYHHYIQMGGSEVVGCPTAGGDCGKRILFEFGFMTLPLVAASLFLFTIALYVYIYKVQR